MENKNDENCPTNCPLRDRAHSHYHTYDVAGKPAYPEDAAMSALRHSKVCDWCYWGLSDRCSAKPPCAPAEKAQATQAAMPRNARWLALAPLLACLLCPGHLLALAGLLGLAWGRGHDPDFGWELWLAIGASVIALCAVEWQIHRRGHCRHEKHS